MINVNKTALDEILRLRKEAELPDVNLRVSVIGGGCSGLTYKLDFQTTANKDDNIIDLQDIKILVDKKSSLFLKNMTLDFSGGLNGKGFIFNNPQSQGECGCGASFKV